MMSERNPLFPTDAQQSEIVTDFNELVLLYERLNNAAPGLEKFITLARNKMQSVLPWYDKTKLWSRLLFREKIETVQSIGRQLDHEHLVFKKTQSNIISTISIFKEAQLHENMRHLADLLADLATKFEFLFLAQWKRALAIVVNVLELHRSEINRYRSDIQTNHQEIHDSLMLLPNSLHFKSDKKKNDQIIQFVIDDTVELQTWYNSEYTFRYMPIVKDVDQLNEITEAQYEEIYSQAAHLFDSQPTQTYREYYEHIIECRKTFEQDLESAKTTAKSLANQTLIDYESIRTTIHEYAKQIQTFKDWSDKIDNRFEKVKNMVAKIYDMSEKGLLKLPVREKLVAEISSYIETGKLVILDHDITVLGTNMQDALTSYRDMIEILEELKTLYP